MSRKVDRIIGFGIFAFAFLVASLYIYLSSSFPPSPEYFNIDAVDYDTLGYNLYLGNGYCYYEGIPTSFRPPIYPLFLSFIYKIFGYNHVPVKYIQALLHGLTALFIFLTGNYIFDRVISALAAVYISVYHPFLYINNMILSEPLFIFLVSLTTYLIILILKGNQVIAPVLVGFVSALAALCRTAIVPFVFLFFPLLLLIEGYKKGVGNYKERLKSLARFGKGSPALIIFLVLIIFILTQSPWVIRNYVVHGKLLLADTHGGWVFWQKYIPFYNFGNFLDNAYKKVQEKGAENVTSAQLFRWVFEDNWFGKEATYRLLTREYPDESIPSDEIGINEFYYRKGIQYIKKNPIGAVMNMLKNGLKFFSPIVTTEGMKGKYSYWFSFIMTFGIVGMILSFRKIDNVLILHFVILNFLLMIMLTYAHNRFRFPADPYMALFAAYAIINIYRNTLKKYKVYLIYILLILLNIALGQSAPHLKTFMKSLF